MQHIANVEEDETPMTRKTDNKRRARQVSPEDYITRKYEYVITPLFSRWSVLSS